MEDLYGDLESRYEDIKVGEIKGQLKDAKDGLQRYKNSSENLSSLVTKLKHRLAVAYRNLSVLFKTAQNEINRKDKIIHELRTKLSYNQKEPKRYLPLTIAQRTGDDLTKRSDIGSEARDRSRDGDDKKRVGRATVLQERETRRGRYRAGAGEGESLRARGQYETNRDNWSGRERSPIREEKIHHKRYRERNPSPTKSSERPNARVSRGSQDRTSASTGERRTSRKPSTSSSSRRPRNMIPSPIKISHRHPRKRAFGNRGRDDVDVDRESDKNRNTGRARVHVRQMGGRNRDRRDASTFSSKRQRHDR
ncbi:hypothetical protein AAMO2058_001499500 [Amorphochlora amoebiformis]